MAYHSIYTGQYIDEKIGMIDNLNENISSNYQMIDELNENISSNYKWKTYTDPTIFGLNPETMTKQDVVDALPQYSILTFWVNGSYPEILSDVNEGLGSNQHYGNIIFKKYATTTRIEFELYQSNATLFNNYTTVNNKGWSASGWTLNTLYPVGSIYISTTDTSPASIFGGAWEQLKDRVLIGAGNTYSGGATGGATSHTHTSAAHTHTVAGHTHSTANHTLTVAQIPSHYHLSYIDANFCAVSTGNINSWKQALVNAENHNVVNGYYDQATGGSGAHNHGNTGSTTLTTNSTTPGATGSSSNLPPYLAVYMWKRTA